MNPFLDHKFCVQRLLSDYLTHGKLIVAFDFDNTIYDYHHKGYDFSEVINTLKRCSDVGFTMVLFTAQERESEVDWRILYCLDRGIKVDYVNESPIMKTIKPYYNILIDDRSGLSESISQLNEILDYIEARKIIIGKDNKPIKTIYSITDLIAELDIIRSTKENGWWIEDRGIKTEIHGTEQRKNKID